MLPTVHDRACDRATAAAYIQYVLLRTLEMYTDQSTVLCVYVLLYVCTRTTISIHNHILKDRRRDLLCNMCCGMYAVRPHAFLLLLLLLLLLLRLSLSFSRLL